MQCARALPAVAFLLLLLTISIQAGQSRPVIPVIDKTVQVSQTEMDNWRRLKEGEVVIQSEDVGETRFVVARILINDAPSNVWRVLTNPFEFEGKISPRMKDVEVLHDAAHRSILKCRMEVFPPLIPYISYTVESDYKPFEHVAFKRVAGSLKEFSGSWVLVPKEDGRATEVTYSMFVDPGVPVPQWIVRKAIRMELPRTLIALRNRIGQYDIANGAEPIRSILAVGPLVSIHPAIKIDKSPLLPALPLKDNK